jgi:hypothetical protein
MLSFTVVDDRQSVLKYEYPVIKFKNIVQQTVERKYEYVQAATTDQTEFFAVHTKLRERLHFERRIDIWRPLSDPTALFSRASMLVSTPDSGGNLRYCVNVELYNKDKDKKGRRSNEGYADNATPIGCIGDNVYIHTMQIPPYVLRRLCCRLGTGKSASLCGYVGARLNRAYMWTSCGGTSPVTHTARPLTLEYGYIACLVYRTYMQCSRLERNRLVETRIPSTD